MNFPRKRLTLARFLLFGGLAATVALLPGFPELLLGGALVVTAGLLTILSLLRLSAVVPSWRRRRPRALRIARELPFISVHVVVEDEPVAAVCRGFDSLARLNYPADRFEVVVTGHSSAADTIARHCRTLGNRFRFHPSEGHLTKAAALNGARRAMAARASVIAVVDAAFEVVPHFLRIAVAALDSREISHVQFPQDHRAGNGGGRAVGRELRHYFHFYAKTAGAGLLPAGSLGVIRRDALDLVGGWESGSLAEDAELGIRLLAAGFHGRYVDVEIGRGPLPPTFAELARRRFRQAAGHARCLARGSHKAGLGRWPAVRQLCAWLDVQVVAVALALVAAIAATLSSQAHPFPQLFALALALWAVAVVAGALPVALATPGGWGARLKACLVHQALAPEASLGTLQGLIRTHLPAIANANPAPAQALGRSPSSAAAAPPMLAFAFIFPVEALLPLTCLGALAFFQVALRRYAALNLSEHAG